MNDNIENVNLDELDAPVFTLTDEETGEEKDFVLLARAEIDEQLYFALEPADEETDEYVSAVAENGLVANNIYFDIVSVGATINVMLAAVCAKGTTILENAARVHI